MRKLIRKMLLKYTFSLLYNNITFVREEAVTKVFLNTDNTYFCGLLYELK